jgi:receptor expression-enhancing protein 5/6
VYPTYATFKLVESKAESSAARACLIYWTVFGLFTLVEGFVDNVLSWVPLYPIARVGFQVWLFTHNFAGAATVYALAVVPILSKVDALLATVSEEIAVKSDKQSSK